MEAGRRLGRQRVCGSFDDTSGSSDSLWVNDGSAIGLMAIQGTPIRASTGSQPSTSLTTRVAMQMICVRFIRSMSIFGRQLSPR